MLELPFFDLVEAPPQGVAMIDYLEKRMPELLADARRLAAAGWDVVVTGTGLRVRPPKAETPDGDPAETLPPVLDALGVESNYRAFVSRTPAEIEAEREWCQDLTRYWDATSDMNCAYYSDYEEGRTEPPIDRYQSRKEIEARCAPRVLPRGSWEQYWQMRARLAALRWVTGRPEYNSVA